MHKMIFLTIIMISGCGYDDQQTQERTLPDNITVINDDARKVTCWVYHGENGSAGGISCISNSNLIGNKRIK